MVITSWSCSPHGAAGRDSPDNAHGEPKDHRSLPNYPSHIRLKCPRSTSTAYCSAASAGAASGSGNSHRR